MSSENTIICQKDPKAFWKMSFLPLDALIIFYGVVILFSVLLPLEYFHFINILSSWPDPDVTIDINLFLISCAMIYFFCIIFWLIHRMEKIKYIHIIVFDNGLLVTKELSLRGYGLSGTPPMNVSFEQLQSIDIKEDWENNWQCVFTMNSGESYLISTEQGYPKDCFSNIVELAERFKVLGKSITISKQWL